MSDESVGAPTSRRYTKAQKEQAVRLVRQIREETGERHGAVQRVARQLGYGVETVRKWVNQADVDDGERSGESTDENAKIRRLSRRCVSCDGPMRSCGRRRLSSRRSSTAHTSECRLHRWSPRPVRVEPICLRPPWASRSPQSIDCLLRTVRRG